MNSWLKNIIFYGYILKKLTMGIAGLTKGSLLCIKGNWQLDAGDIIHVAQIYPIGQGDNALDQSNLGAKKSICYFAGEI